MLDFARWYLRTYSNGGPDILGKEDALELNDEEVQELLNVTGDALEGLARDGVVLPRADLGGDALAEDEVADNLGGGGASENGESGLEQVALDRYVAEEKDGGDDGGEGDGGRARVLPAQERVEEGVVVSELLTCGSLAVRSLAGSGQVGELVLGGGGLGASLVGHGTVGDGLHGLGVLDGVHGVGGSCWLKLGCGLGRRPVGDTLAI